VGCPDPWTALPGPRSDVTGTNAREKRCHTRAAATSADRGAARFRFVDGGTLAGGCADWKSRIAFVDIADAMRKTVN
jgi:hypothetical protein